MLRRGGQARHGWRRRGVLVASDDRDRGEDRGAKGFGRLDHVVGGIDNIYTVASGNLDALTSGADSVSADEPAAATRTNVPR